MDPQQAESARRRTKPAAERRREILDAALGLFRDKGFTETTVQDIADAAGVAIGTVYIHYPSKERILGALHESFHLALAETMAEAAGEILESQARGQAVDLAAATRRMLDLTATFMTAHRDECEVVMKYLPGPDVLRAEKVLVEFLTRTLEVGAAQGIVETPDPEMTARLMSAAIGFTIGSAVAYGDPPDLPRLVDAATDFLTRALSPRA